MDLIELLGALHHALQRGASVADTEAWQQAFDAIRAEVEADPSTDRYDRETLDVIDRKLQTLIGEIKAGVPEPDFEPARTWVAALGTAIHRRWSTSAPPDDSKLN